MKISIAVPSYNYAPYLSACLESIRMQDFNDYEVLIAEGGSGDGSLEIIERFCSLDSRFRLVSTEDQGQADAIVKAFGYADGDLFCFLNSDDCFICNDALSSVVAAFKKYPETSIVSFSGYYIDYKGNYIRPVKLRYHPKDSIEQMKYRTAVLQPATFWRREVYEAIPIMTDSHYIFDALFFYQVYREKFSWLELPKPVAGHRLHGDNKSLEVRCERIREISKFEGVKFGEWGFRSVYIYMISFIVMIFDKIPFAGKYLNLFVYVIVNSISFLSFYRIPGI